MLHPPRYADLYINDGVSLRLAPFSSFKIDLQSSDQVVGNILMHAHGVRLKQWDMSDKNPLTPVLLILNDATWPRLTIPY